MQTSDLLFSALRRMLLDLNFTEKAEPSAPIVFEHPPSDTFLIFRHYDLKEKVNWPDLVSVRKQLDERGLLSQDTFDHLLRKNSA